MELYVEYADGNMRCQILSLDLFNCQAYADFCKQTPELLSMYMTVNEATRVRNKLNKNPIEGMTPGDTGITVMKIYRPILMFLLYLKMTIVSMWCRFISSIGVMYSTLLYETT